MQKPNLIEHIRYTMIRGEIPDNLLLEIFLAITHVSNLLLKSFFKGQFPFKTSFKSLSNLEYLYILGLTVYDIIYNDEEKVKSTKWAP